MKCRIDMRGKSQRSNFIAASPQVRTVTLYPPVIKSFVPRDRGLAAERVYSSKAAHDAPKKRMQFANVPLNGANARADFSWHRSFALKCTAMDVTVAAFGRRPKRDIPIPRLLIRFSRRGFSETTYFAAVGRSMSALCERARSSALSPSPATMAATTLPCDVAMASRSSYLSFVMAMCRRTCCSTSL